jgi:hypothetical protein
MRLQFEYFDFTPRKEFEMKANQILNDLRTNVPFDCECEARCTYFANKFFFQIVFRSDDITLSAQSILDPNKEDTKVRGWQVKAIDNMSTLLKKQIAKFESAPMEFKTAA